MKVGNQERLEREYKVLDIHVLVVAAQGGARYDWACYAGAVKGENHDEEWQDVLDHGSKLHRKLAEFLFPEFAKKFEYRE